MIDKPVALFTDHCIFRHCLSLPDKWKERGDFGLIVELKHLLSGLVYISDSANHRLLMVFFGQIKCWTCWTQRPATNCNELVNRIPKAGVGVCFRWLLARKHRVAMDPQHWRLEPEDEIDSYNNHPSLLFSRSKLTTFFLAKPLAPSSPIKHKTKVARRSLFCQ